MNWITTVIGFAMSATFIVFICARLICGRMRRFESPPMFEIDSRMIDLEQAEHHRISGLEPVVVAAIPTMKFTREAFSSLEDPQCTICLGEYQEKEVLRIMPKCGHSFHVSCIDLWLRKQSTCPVCRLSVEDPFKTKFAAAIAPPVEMSQRMQMPNSPIEHSQQWLLPVAEPSEGNSDSHRQTEVVSENPQHIHSGDVETRS